MLPPPLPSSGPRPPVLRIMAELGRRLLVDEARVRLDALKHEPVGYVARALGERHRQIREEGRAWTEADIQDFIERRLPVALEQAASAREASSGTEKEEEGDHGAGR